MADGGTEHHVTFEEEQNSFEKSSSIVIKKISERELEVHLGFLKVNNTYEILVPFHIPDHIPNNNDWISDESLLSPYSSLKKYEQVGECGNLVFDFKAGKPKLMKDTLKLRSASEPQMCLELRLIARVLAKGQGTPMLKDGIHNIAVEMDEESEASDWQGFE